MPDMLVKALWFAGVGLVVGTGAFVVNAVWFRPWSLQVFFTKSFFEVFADQPESLSAYGVAEKWGYRRHNTRLDDLSLAKVQRRFDTLRRVRAQAAAYGLEGRPQQDRLSLRVLLWHLDDTLAGERFAFHDYPVNQLFGVQSETADFMVNLHRLQDGRDAEHYLARLRDWPRKFSELEAGLRHRAALGVLPPRFVFERVIAQIEGFLSTAPAQNVLVTSFAERLQALPSVAASRRDRLTAEAATLVESHVYPAYRSLLATWKMLSAKATDDDGVWKLPDGDAYYAHLLRSQTSTHLTPDEIHQIGLAEVARIESEMRTILDAQGHTGSTPAEWLRTLATDPRFQFPNTAEGRAQALARYQALTDEALALAPRFFGHLPKARMEVRRIPEFKEATSPGAYYMQPALDGSRPGVFYVNLRDLREIEQWGMKTLTYHEAVPGHHFQLAIAAEMPGLPLFRRTLWFTAYGEGWALYAEHLALEMGLYSKDPYGNLGRLRDELFRAVRLVVDTGLHAKRWTRQAAIDYMKSKTGQAESEVVSEVERYIVMPAQACTYKIGMLHLQDLRQKAEQQLGARFDLRAFHDFLLGNGGLPLEILDEEFARWLNESHAR
ncbi:DUF885 domain-containing protein [Nibricoccus sp. IMCC34717]|uniref:DUF885 domain-containing protein n=1 Tax=Nibricoccus sp. IMCC34717 TaxID=3034021 RepID=UPI00384D2A4C